MDLVINILTAVYALCCLIIIVLVLAQKSERGGASESIMGSSANNFYEKNKGRTKEGKLRSYTIVFSIIFVILTMALTVLNMR